MNKKRTVIYPILKSLYCPEQNVKWNLYNAIHLVVLPKTNELRAKIKASYFGDAQLLPTVLIKTPLAVSTSSEVAHQPKAMKENGDGSEKHSCK